MPNSPNLVYYFDFFIGFLLFIAILGVFHVLGCTQKLPGYKKTQEDGLGWLTLQIGMLLRFFEYFLLIYCDFRRFSRVLMHLEALRIQ
jgi:hypothetical protein